MRRFLFLLFLGSLVLSAPVVGKANTVVVRLGETIYARFESSGKKLKLVSASKEKDEQAQVIFTLWREAESLDIKLKVENKFPKDLIYEAVASAKRLDRKSRVEVSPVVAGKMSFETLNALVDELTCSGFKLER